MNLSRLMRGYVPAGQREPPHSPSPSGSRSAESQMPDLWRLTFAVGVGSNMRAPDGGMLEIRRLEGRGVRGCDACAGASRGMRSGDRGGRSGMGDRFVSEVGGVINPYGV